jgi:hypothetical protein
MAMCFGLFPDITDILAAVWIVFSLPEAPSDWRLDARPMWVLNACGVVEALLDEEQDEVTLLQDHVTPVGYHRSRARPARRTRPPLR